jgi:hypothetical protein
MKRQADRGPQPQVAEARQSTEEDVALAALAKVRASQAGDAYWDLVQATAQTIQDWAFWRWLGRRTHFIPWEAYQGITVRADGQILDVGATTVAAAYQRLRGSNRGRQWPNVGETPRGWRSFLWYVQGEAQRRNVLKGMRPDDKVPDAMERGNRDHA